MARQLEGGLVPQIRNLADAHEWNFDALAQPPSAFLMLLPTPQVEPISVRKTPGGPRAVRTGSDPEGETKLEGSADSAHERILGPATFRAEPTTLLGRPWQEYPTSLPRSRRASV